MVCNTGSSSPKRSASLLSSGGGITLTVDAGRCQDQAVRSPGCNTAPRGSCQLCVLQQRSATAHVLGAWGSTAQRPPQSRTAATVGTEGR